MQTPTPTSQPSGSKDETIALADAQPGHLYEAVRVRPPYQTEPEVRLIPTQSISKASLCGTGAGVAAPGKIEISVHKDGKYSVRGEFYGTDHSSIAITHEEVLRRLPHYLAEMRMQVDLDRRLDVTEGQALYARFVHSPRPSTKALNSIATAMAALESEVNDLGGDYRALLLRAQLATIRVSVDRFAAELESFPEKSKRNQATAVTESAQSATESVAFQYKQQAPRIPGSYKDQAWFAPEDKALDVDVSLSRNKLALVTFSHGAEGSFSTSKYITPTQARQIAAALLNAADFAEANPDFGKARA